MKSLSVSDLKYEMGLQLFEAMDLFGVNYVLHSLLLPACVMPWGSDIDIIIDPDDRNVFIDALRTLDAARVVKSYPEYMENYILHKAGVMVSIDISWGGILKMPGHEKWRLPMITRGKRVRLHHGGFRPDSTTTLLFLAARYSSTSKGVSTLAQGWSDQVRIKWRNYFDAFFNSVQGEEHIRIINQVDEYARSSRVSLAGESWFYPLKSLFRVEACRDVKGAASQPKLNAKKMVFIKGGDKVDNKGLVRHLYEKKWPTAICWLKMVGDVKDIRDHFTDKESLKLGGLSMLEYFPVSSQSLAQLYDAEASLVKPECREIKDSIVFIDVDSLLQGKDIGCEGVSYLGKICKSHTVVEFVDTRSSVTNGEDIFTEAMGTGQGATGQAVKVYVDNRGTDEISDELSLLMTSVLGDFKGVCDLFGLQSV